MVSNIQVQNNQMTNYNKTTPITAKSEVSQSTAISDRPKAKAKNSRKHQQPQQSGTTVRKTLINLLLSKNLLHGTYFISIIFFF